jgi:hypothetical protein
MLPSRGIQSNTFNALMLFAVLIGLLASPLVAIGQKSPDYMPGNLTILSPAMRKGRRKATTSHRKASLGLRRM